MIWDLLGTEKRVEDALIRQMGKDYDISPHELTGAGARRPAADFDRAAGTGQAVTCMLRYRTPRA